MLRPAARLGDLHVCGMFTGPVPHIGGPILSGAPNVFLGKQPAARVGDVANCVGPPDAIAMGSSKVFICNQPAARVGDATVHGGTIGPPGCVTVFVG